MKVKQIQLELMMKEIGMEMEFKIGKKTIVVHYGMYQTLMAAELMMAMKFLYFGIQTHVDQSQNWNLLSLSGMQEDLH